MKKNKIYISCCLLNATCISSCAKGQAAYRVLLLTYEKPRIKTNLLHKSFVTTLTYQISWLMSP